MCECKSVSEIELIALECACVTELRENEENPSE